MEGGGGRGEGGGGRGKREGGGEGDGDGRGRGRWGGERAKRKRVGWRGYRHQQGILCTLHTTIPRPPGRVHYAELHS